MSVIMNCLCQHSVSSLDVVCINFIFIFLKRLLSQYFCNLSDKLPRFEMFLCLFKRLD